MLINGVRVTGSNATSWTYSPPAFWPETAAVNFFAFSPTAAPGVTGGVTALAGQNDATLGSASPFNIAKMVLTLRNFTKDEIVELYGQHTADTGQEFEPEAVETVYQQTQGQPWLVNAIACEVVEQLLKKNYTRSVTGG